jgi:hypothetical protein
MSPWERGGSLDWIGALIFALIMIFKALGESEKQKKKRAARQGRTSPAAPPPVAQPVPQEEVFPPVFPFPLFEEEKEPVQVEELLEEPEPVMIEDLPPPRPSYEVYLKEEPKVTVEVPPREIKQAPAGTLPGLQLNQAMQGIIWSEVLQPPRAMRPFGSRATRGRRY